MKKTMIILAVCTVLALAGGLYYFNREEPEITAPADKAKSSTLANLTFSGSSLAEERDGRKIWDLSAEKIEVDADKKQVKLLNIKGVFYDDKGGHIEMVAKNGIVDTETRNVALEGEVRGVSSDGAVFLAKEVLWTSYDRQVFGSGGITLTKEDTVITGEKIEGDAAMEKVRVWGNARAVKGGLAQ